MQPIFPQQTNRTLKRKQGILAQFCTDLQSLKHLAGIIEQDRRKRGLDKPIISQLSQFSQQAYEKIKQITKKYVSCPGIKDLAHHYIE